MILAKMAELDYALAQNLVLQLVHLLRYYERHPITKPEPVLFAFYHCFKMSPNLVRVAKEKELVSKLIGLIS
jgi:hypothetical protein